jgi:chromosome segregation ATPase
LRYNIPFAETDEDRRELLENMAEKYLTIEDLDVKVADKEKEYDDLKKTHDQ